MNSEWLDIIKKVKSGEISVDEGARLLEESGVAAASEPLAAPVLVGPENEPEPDEPHYDLGWWANAWLLPFWIGTGIFVVGAILMGWAYSSHPGFWMVCSWFTLLFGLFILFLGWWSRNAHWVHVRVNEAGGTRVSISLPLPLRLAAFLLRIFGPLFPKIREQHLENLPDIFDVLAGERGPLTVEVDEEGGTQVRVYILSGQGS